MAETDYTYSVANDTANGAVANWVLKQEILAKSTITIAPKDVYVAADVLTITMKDALSAGEQTDLTNVVAAHAGKQTETSMPHTTDGKPIFLPQLFRGDVTTTHTGVGDDITNGTRWAGTRCRITRSTAGDQSGSFQFMEWVYLAGGGGYYRNANYGDYVDLCVVAPATAGTSNVGAGAYDKVVAGTGYIFVPNGTTTGDWDLNLTEKLNANVGFTKVVPVPNEANTGWFDWEENEVVSFNSAQLGRFDLYDFETTLARFVVEVPVLGDGDMHFSIPAIKPKRILPHWRFDGKLHNESGGNTLEVAWNLFIGRKSSA